MAMNATTYGAAWAWFAPSRKKRLKRRQAGYVLEATRAERGMPAEVANAHARFEYAARQALREWLMV
jgi:hypothetical protein